MGAYLRTVVVDLNGAALANAIGKIYDVNDTGNTTPLPIFSLSGTAFPLDQLIANDDGVLPEFNTPGRKRVKWVSGLHEIGLVAWDQIPTGGAVGQNLQKNGTADYEIGWASPLNLPTGGVDGQVLTKDGSSNFVTRWDTPASGDGGTGGSLPFTSGFMAFVQQSAPGASWSVRPTSDPAVKVFWFGYDNWPSTVASGVNGPHANDVLSEIVEVTP